MKKLLALLLATIMCLCLTACSGGNDTPPTNDKSGNNASQENDSTENTDNDSGDESAVDFINILMNMGTFWSCVNRSGMGYGFINDGTTVNPDGTWELVDNKVTITLEDGTSDSYEIKNKNGVYYLVGDRDILYDGHINTEDIPFKEVEITIDNWQEYFELAFASEEKTDIFGEPTGEVEEACCLKMKDEYFKNFVRDNGDVRIRYTYNGSENDAVMVENSNELMGSYFGVHGVDSKLGFEMIKVQGTLRFVDGI